MHTGILCSHTGYNVTNYFYSGVSSKKTVENAASGCFESNFSGAAFCLPHQIGGLLARQNAARWRFALWSWGPSVCVVVVVVVALVRNKVRESCIWRTI